MRKRPIKGIIAAGGKGTRLFPVTRSVNKCILPVYDKPALYYQICAMIIAGIREIKVFGNERDIPLYRDLMGDGTQWGIDICYGLDEPPRATPGVLVTAQDFIGESDVLVLLGDNVFFGEGLDRALEMAAGRFRKDGGMLICTKEVRDPRGLGTVVYDDSGRPLSIGGKLEPPKSDHGVTGLFFFDHDAVEDVLTEAAGNDGEIILGEFLKSRLEKGALQAVSLDDSVHWFDMGTAERLFEAGSAVRAFQEAHGTCAGCVEEAAAARGLIDDRQLEDLARAMEGTEYGRYLMGLVGKYRR